LNRGNRLIFSDSSTMRTLHEDNPIGLPPTDDSRGDVPDLLRWYGGMGVPGTGDYSLRRVRS